MTHHTMNQKTDDVSRGALLRVAGGYVVADTLSAAGTVEKPEPFWFDTDGGRHFPNPTDGTLEVRVPTFETQAFGQDPDGGKHVLINRVPGGTPRAYCDAAEDRKSPGLDVWESGTALASVACPDCRKAIGLVNTPHGERKRESNGI